MILMKGDCLELMKNIPDKSVDLILCDLPYGTTSCHWDSVIPFEPLWSQYRRIIKDRRAIVLFAGEPFASTLRLSNIAWYKYDWIWEKNNAVGFVNAKLKPMNKHEVVCVFSNGKTSNRNNSNMIYNPQDLKPYNKTIKNSKMSKKENTYDRPSTNSTDYFQQWTNYPASILKFNRPSKAVHPTQKPVPLLEYLIRTYSNEGDVVLDNCMGSGSTGVAAVNTDRNFIGIELTDKYFQIAKERIDEAVKSRKEDLF